MEWTEKDLYSFRFEDVSRRVDYCRTGKTQIIVFPTINISGNKITIGEIRPGNWTSSAIYSTVDGKGWDSQDTVLLEKTVEEKKLTTALSLNELKKSIDNKVTELGLVWVDKDSEITANDEIGVDTVILHSETGFVIRSFKISSHDADDQFIGMKVGARILKCNMEFEDTSNHINIEKVDMVSEVSRVKEQVFSQQEYESSIWYPFVHKLKELIYNEPFHETRSVYIPEGRVRQMNEKVCSDIGWDFDNPDDTEIEDIINDLAIFRAANVS